ncbi:hypothetical protein ACH492_38450 [Streptomyces sp. NPDC019443]|uniref:hypothetical protein n=1 Tax=Streptomyces sp. NPDC019443 TaxID=3365061 RepID=UPI00378F66ED
MDPLLVARTQGLFNATGGAWPLLHLRSFKHFFGPRGMREEQDWLVKTVAGLLITCGWSLLLSSPTSESLSRARITGLGTALTLLAVDVVYVPKGQARRSHVLDAVIEST